MVKLGRWAGYLSFAVFMLFVANVVAGAFYRSAFLSDIGEMLVLFTASALFVVVILVREKLAGKDDVADPSLQALNTIKGGKNDRRT